MFVTGGTLDSAFKARVRAVLDGERVTEAELRKLFEEGRACALILNGQLENTERELRALAASPDSSIADLAAAFRRVSEIRPDLDELNLLLAELDHRAREFRTSWLSGLEPLSASATDPDHSRSSSR